MLSKCMMPLLSCMAILALPVSAKACPVINGSYATIYLDGGKPLRRVFHVFTRTGDTGPEYRFWRDGPFYPSDNVFRPFEVGGQTGLVKARCNAAEVYVTTKDGEKGKESTRSHRKITDDELSITFETENGEIKGVYRKLPNS